MTFSEKDHIAGGILLSLHKKNNNEIYIDVRLENSVFLLEKVSHRV